MLALFCKVKKIPKVGDDLRICYTHKIRGGRSEACCILNRTHFYRRLEANEEPGDREIWNEQPDPFAPAVVWVKLADDESKAAIISSLARVISDSWVGE